jgi:ribosomal protein L11 methyltransferase
MSDSILGYYRYDFTGNLSDIDLAALYELGFESFEEKENHWEGYLHESLVDDRMDAQIRFIIPYQMKTLVRSQNWNQLWESQFQPISIGNRLHVRASFHPATTSAIEIIIDPKMAFGTGHHATTYLMLQEMMRIDMLGKSVLDFGTGSGILAIAAEKLGARKVLAIDHDHWAIDNTIENLALNGCDSVQVFHSDHLESIPSSFDIMIANITRDTLLQHNTRIWELLPSQGLALYSGFLLKDLFPIRAALEKLGMLHSKAIFQDGWVCFIWEKP